jgi:hypothetical protein
MMEAQNAAPSAIHVLLIGIDAYQGGISLDGCVNDIDAIQRVLVDRLHVGVDRIKRLAAPHSGARHETDVPGALPTRENLLRALEALGSEHHVAPGDRVFIYYSGHGTQCRIKGPSGKVFDREALLPVDHIDQDQRHYLFDWELNRLLARIAMRTAAVTVILDCCCAAGATRAALTAKGARERFAPSPELYVLSPQNVPEIAMGSRGIAAGVAGSVKTCQVIAACLADERAVELDVDGIRHGALTRALLDQLEKIEDAELAELRWGRIWRSVVSAVRSISPAQHPWLFGGFARALFGGPPEGGDLGLSVVRYGDSYRIDAGSLLGVTDGAEIAIYPCTPAELPPLGSRQDSMARTGLLRVTRAERSSAEAVAVAPFDLPPGARGRMVKAGQDAKLFVALDPADATLAAELDQSPFLKVVRAGAEADITLVGCADGAWTLTDDVFGAGGDEPVLVTIPPDRRKSIRAVTEHYYLYSAPLRLAKNCIDLPSCLKLTALDCNGLPELLAPDAAQDPDLPEVPAGRRANYELKDGDQICFAIENCSRDDLLVTLIDCQTDGSVVVLAENKIAAGQRHVVWCLETLGNPFQVHLPEGHLGIDRVVAIGTTDLRSSLKHLQVDETFVQACEGGFRNIGFRRGDGKVKRWTSAVTVLRIEQ